jgi:type I restriction enzyme S subunit
MNSPDHWEIAELQELGEWQTGSTPRRSNEEYWGGEILWVSPKDMKTEKIVDTEDQMTEKALEETNSKLIKPGSIVVVTRSGILEHSFPVAVTDKPVTINQDLKAFIPGDRLDENYAYYFLRANELDILKTCSKDGTTVASINSDSLYTYEIPIPPLAHQERIVAKIEEMFTKLDSGVSELQKGTELLKKYQLSLMNAAFGGMLSKRARTQNRWEFNQDFEAHEDPPDILEIPPEWRWVAAGTVIKSLRNGIYKPKEYYTNDGIASLRMYNIEDGQIVWKDIKRMELTNEELEKYRLEPGDLLVNRVNSRELVGKAAAIPAGLEECVFESKNIRVKPTQDVRGEYLGHWFYLFRKRHFMSQVKQTVGQATITQTQIKEMPIPLAPIAEQDHILKEIERQESILSDFQKQLESNLTRAERLRQSMLKRTFEGNLILQEPAEEPPAPDGGDTRLEQGTQATLSEVTNDVE